VAGLPASLLSALPETELRSKDFVVNHKRIEFNTEHPHSSLGYKPPSQFAGSCAARRDGVSYDEGTSEPLTDVPEVTQVSVFDANSLFDVFSRGWRVARVSIVDLPMQQPPALVVEHPGRLGELARGRTWFARAS